MTVSTASDLSLRELLIVEDDSAILDFRCDQTGILVWPQIRVAFLRMMLSDLIYGVKLTGKTSATIPVTRAAHTFARSVAHNLQYRMTGRCKANICVMADGVANQWVGEQWFNRLAGHFGSACPSDTLLIEDHFEWRWPFPRHHNHVLLHAPLQAINAIKGRLSVREHHRQRARRLVNLVTQRAQRYLQWSPGQVRHDQLVEMLARKTASMPSQYAAYLALLERIQPRLLMVGAACYGPAASLIAAAKSQGIVTAEYQHGAVSGGHDAYNFAPAIRDSEDYRRTLPDYFLGYGSWWNEQINAPVKKLAIGNPHRTAKLAETESGVSQKSDLLILSDGIEFDIYLRLAQQLRDSASGKDLRVVLRPHPLERTRVAALPDSQTCGVVIDTNPDLYASLRTAHTVISEVSTGLFEAVGIVDNIFIWDTQKTRFTFPTSPFQSFGSTAELVDLIQNDAAGRMSTGLIDAIWASGWRQNYSEFLDECGIRCDTTAVMSHV